MFKKQLLPIIILGIFSFGLSHADFKNEDTGRKIAELYLESNKNDDFWKDNSPRLGEGTPLYMEKETPSYVEYQVVCEKNPSCGFIIVNIDGDDVQVPTSSTADTPPTNILTKKSGDTKENLQFYYFSPFDIYSKNTLTNQINAINPQINPTEDDIAEEMQGKEREEVQLMMATQNKELPKIFDTQLQKIKEFKDSDDFQQYLQDKNQSDYIPQSSTWKYIPGSTTSNCNSRIPCYKQYNYNYGCAIGCSPVAAGMIMGYYDRNGKWKLVDGVNDALDVNTGGNNPTDNMIKQMRNYMNTTCSGNQGSTFPSDIQNAKYYATSHGYPFSGALYHQSGNSSPAPFLLTPEIDAGKPLILQIYRPNQNWYPGAPSTVPKRIGHAVVMYAYNVNTIAQVKINAGWGNGNTSSAVVHLGGMTLNGYTRSFEGYTTFTVQ